MIVQQNKKIETSRAWQGSPVAKRFLCYIALLCILVLGFVLGMESFRSYADRILIDTNRDYMVAHHIVHYGEVPLTGPEGLAGSRHSSPVYYYFLASLVAIQDNIIFLGYVNLFLRIFVLLEVYILATNLFNKKVGVTAAFLYSISMANIEQARFFWQPYLMEPFLLLSYLLLFWAYRKKNYFFLLASIIIFIFSTTIHPPAFGILPIYLFAIIFVLRLQQRTLRYTAGVFLTFSAALFLGYFPILLYAFQSNAPSTDLFSPISDIFFRQPPYVLINNLFVRVQIFLDFFFVQLPAREWTAFLTIGILAALNIIYPKDRTKPYITMIMVAIVQFLLVVTMINGWNEPTVPIRYFTPIFALFIIFISSSIHKYQSKSIVSHIGKISLILLFVYIISPKLVGQIQWTGQRLRGESIIKFFSVSSFIAPSVIAIKNEVLAIRREEKDYLFFRIKSYQKKFSYDDFFWRTLEKELDTKLIKLDDAARRDYSPITTDEYIFMVCFSKRYMSDEYISDDECINRFHKENPRYSIIKNIYQEEEFSIYLTKSLNL